MALNESPKFVSSAGRTRGNRITDQIAADIHCQSVHGCVSTAAVLFHRLHHNPVEVSSDFANQPWRLNLAMARDSSKIGSHEGAQARGWAGRLDVADNAPNFIKATFEKFGGVKGYCSGQQLVKQHPEAVDVAARVHVHARQRGLFGAHVSRRAYQ